MYYLVSVFLSLTGFNNRLAKIHRSKPGFKGRKIRWIHLVRVLNFTFHMNFLRQSVWTLLFVTYCYFVRFFEFFLVCFNGISFSSSFFFFCFPSCGISFWVSFIFLEYLYGIKLRGTQQQCRRTTQGGHVTTLRRVVDPGTARVKCISILSLAIYRPSLPQGGQSMNWISDINFEVIVQFFYFCLDGKYTKWTCVAICI